MSGDPTCRALRPECFPPGKVRDDLIRERFSDGFKVPDDKIPKFSGDEKASSARKPICAGSGCPPSNVEELSKEVRETLGEVRS
jgi:hypothetical protein